MIGDDYFELRARTGTALYSLSKLGQEVRLHPARISLLQNLTASLKEPFLFVVAGEVNSGKSTFLNGLFGEEFCETAVVPMTSKIHYFRHGEELRQIEVSDTLVEFYRPNSFLKDFHLVDTPGTNSIEEQHQEITERYIPMADLVIFVFSVTNPWGASNWELLDRIHRKWFKNVVFVLQQCDLRAPEEVEAIVEHMRVTAKQRLGATFPVFCVSAKKALLAKTTGVDKERLWRESRFEELEKYTSEAVSSAASRLHRIQNTTQTARVILGEVKNRLSDAVGTLKTDSELLDRLKRAVQKQKALSGGKFVGLLEAFDNDYMTLGIETGDYVESRLSIGASLKSLFGNEEAPGRAEDIMMNGLVSSVRERAQGVVETLGRDLKQLRERLVDHIDEYFDYDVPVSDDAALPGLSAAADALAEDMERCVRENLGRLELRKGLEAILAGRRRTLRAILAVAAIGTAGAIGTTIAGMSPYNLVSAAMAVVSLVAIGTFANRNAGDIARALGKRLEGNRDDLSSELKKAFEGGVDRVFAEFIKIFNPLREICEEHRSMYEPKIRQLEDLGNSFREIQEVVSRFAAGRLEEVPQESRAKA